MSHEGGLCFARAVSWPNTMTPWRVWPGWSAQFSLQVLSCMTRSDWAGLLRLHAQAPTPLLRDLLGHKLHQASVHAGSLSVPTAWCPKPQTPNPAGPTPHVVFTTPPPPPLNVMEAVPGDQPIPGTTEVNYMLLLYDVFDILDKVAHLPGAYATCQHVLMCRMQVCSPAWGLCHMSTCADVHDAGVLPCLGPMPPHVPHVLPFLHPPSHALSLSLVAAGEGPRHQSPRVCVPQPTGARSHLHAPPHAPHPPQRPPQPGAYAHLTLAGERRWPYRCPPLGQRHAHAAAAVGGQLWLQPGLQRGRTRVSGWHTKCGWGSG